MSETKLTPAQKRAIREARGGSGRLWNAPEHVIESLRKRGLAKQDPIYEGIYCLTHEGETVEVGDEDR